MDPLSALLGLLRVTNYHSATLSLGGNWAFDFPQRGGIKFTAVVKGSCLLKVDGESTLQRLHQGDCFLMTRGVPFQLYSDTSLPPMDSNDYIVHRGEREIALHYNGDDVQLVGGRFEFTGMPARVLLDMLPPVVHVHGESLQASALRWLLERLSQELHETKYGRSLIAEHYAHIMLVEVLRVHLSSRSHHDIGWFSALADKQLGAAIAAVHNALSFPWTVDNMANRANMSRSAFAHRFKDVVGLSPMEYLTRWRMLQACDMLKNGELSISTIAFELGYQSESAFSNAFKRIMTLSPRHYQRLPATGMRILPPISLTASPDMHQ